MTAYAFRPMSANDLPTIRRWLETPHVGKWWHDPAEQFALVSGDLDHPDMVQFIVTADGREFAYLQCYVLSTWNTGLGPQPEADMLGRGHGSGFVRAFTDGLLTAGTPRVVTDPDPANITAIRAYEKAGFRRDHLVDTPDGKALLMTRDS